MICCGTNFLVRRAALDEVGGFPVEGLIEDVELSIKLQEAQWKIVYLNQVLARGLGPEDMSAYVSQQLRWARGCVYAIGLVIRANIPFRIRLQYLHSCLFFLTGWTILLYLSLPVIFIFTGAQPFNGSTSTEMLLYFAPYYIISLVVVAAAGGGSYTFEAYCLYIANFWIQIAATIYVLTGSKMTWVVTAKQGSRTTGAGECRPGPGGHRRPGGDGGVRHRHRVHLVGGQQPGLRRRCTRWSCWSGSGPPWPAPRLRRPRPAPDVRPLPELRTLRTSTPPSWSRCESAEASVPGPTSPNPPARSAEHESADGEAAETEAEGSSTRAPPGRMIIAVLIVVLTVAAVAALSVTGARDHRPSGTEPITVAERWPGNRGIPLIGSGRGRPRVTTDPGGTSVRSGRLARPGPGLSPPTCKTAGLAPILMTCRWPPALSGGAARAG